jgi:hypothetical protein
MNQHSAHPARSRQVITDAAAFLERVQSMGLVLLLQGDEIAALTAAEAVIRIPTGAHQTYWRRLTDSLHPSERALLRELGQGP